jgi:hypothetical protein
MFFSNLFKKGRKTNTFDVLAGKKLLRVREPELVQQPSSPGAQEYTNAGLGFSDDCDLAIENKYTFINAKKLEDFIDEKIESIDYNESNVSFSFSHTKKIIVSLKTEDWNGPEAMQLNYKGQIYIWN